MRQQRYSRELFLDEWRGLFGVLKRRGYSITGGLEEGYIYKKSERVGQITSIGTFIGGHRDTIVKIATNNQGLTRIVSSFLSQRRSPSWADKESADSLQDRLRRDFYAVN